MHAAGAMVAGTVFGATIVRNSLQNMVGAGMSGIRSALHGLPS